MKRFPYRTPMPIYSHSRLASFEQCPLKYKFTYVDGIKRKRTSIEAFMGSRFHEVMEELYGRIAFEIPTLTSLLELYDSQWDKHWSSDVFVTQPERKADDYRTIGRRAIEDYYQRYHPFDQGRVVGLEREIIFDLTGEGRYQLRAIIDRLMAQPNGTFEIHDYKTSGKFPEQASVDHDRQLALYEMAVRSAWPEVQSVDLIWHYVAFDQELHSHRSREELTALKEDLIGLIDEIERTTEFPPHESFLCSWCDHREICPLFAHESTAATPPNPYEREEGAALVNIYAALEEQKQELANRIHHFEAEQEKVREAAIAKANALSVTRLFGLTHTLTIKPDLKVQYPKKGELTRTEFEARMRELHFWDQVQDLSWQSVKTLALSEGWAENGVPEGLSPFVAITPSSQVRLARKKGTTENNS